MSDAPTQQTSSRHRRRRGIAEALAGPPTSPPSSPLAVTLTDLVLAQIDTHLAVPEPEQGGALLRPVNGRAITTFMPDEHATTTRVSYMPSAELVAQVAQHEALHDVTLVGVIHSHPNGMNRLSGPDLDVTRHLLQLNRHLGWVCMPIVTQLTAELPLQAHEVRLPHGRVSCFLARLDHEDRLHVATPSAIRTVPVARLADAVASALAVEQHGSQDLVVGGVATIGVWFTLDADLTLWVLVSHDYPLAAPLLAVDTGDGLVPLPIATLPGHDADQVTAALVERLRHAFAPDRTDRYVPAIPDVCDRDDASDDDPAPTHEVGAAAAPPIATDDPTSEPKEHP